MHYYQKNISDFNNQTRHLSRLERSIFEDAKELYLSSEKPLDADFDRLARILIVRDDDEKEALRAVLSEFFTIEENGYFSSAIEAEIAKYKSNLAGQKKAGEASAEAARKKYNQFKTAAQIRHENNDKVGDAWVAKMLARARDEEQVVENLN